MRDMCGCFFPEGLASWIAPLPGNPSLMLFASLVWRDSPQEISPLSRTPTLTTRTSFWPICPSSLSPGNSAPCLWQVLQSFHYRLEDEVRQTLRGWYDLLEPGGRLYLSVPDFPTLCWLYLNPTSNMNGRFRILQMMMGSQEGKHKVKFVAVRVTADR